MERLPAVRLVAFRDVLREGELGRAVDLDLVVVVEHDQAPQAQVAREGARLRRDALLHAAVSADDIDKVVDDLEAVLVEGRGHLRGGEREPHAVGHPLP